MKTTLCWSNFEILSYQLSLMSSVNLNNSLRIRFYPYVMVISCLVSIPPQLAMMIHILTFRVMQLTET